MRRVKQGSCFVSLLAIAMLLLSPLSFFNPRVSAQGVSIADVLFETGKQYYDWGDHQQALKQWEKTLLIEPGHAQALRYIQIIKDMQGSNEQDLGGVVRKEAVAQYLLEAETKLVSEQDILPPEPKIKLQLVREAEASIGPTIPQRVPSEYILGVGDNIEVAVWRHPDLNRTVAIRPDGMISLPVVGEIKASGFSPAQVSKIVASRLRRYIRDPQVSVIVTKFKDTTILVLGEVGSPGVYKIFGHMTVLEAIAGAGSYRKYAGLRTTLVVREGYSDSPEIICTDLLDVILKGKFENDVVLKPGDIVFLPQTALTHFTDFMDLFNRTIRPVARTYLDYKDEEMWDR